jgi:hypothetical protein
MVMVTRACRVQEEEEDERWDDCPSDLTDSDEDSGDDDA